jgi:hypothetical protein
VERVVPVDEEAVRREEVWRKKVEWVEWVKRPLRSVLWEMMGSADEGSCWGERRRRGLRIFV